MEHTEEHEFSSNRSSNKSLNHRQRTEALLTAAPIQEVVANFFLTLREWTSHSTVPKTISLSTSIQHHSSNIHLYFRKSRQQKDGCTMHLKSKPSVPLSKMIANFSAVNDYIESSWSTQTENPVRVLQDHFTLSKLFWISMQTSTKRGS